MSEPKLEVELVEEPPEEDAEVPETDIVERKTPSMLLRRRATEDSKEFKA